MDATAVVSGIMGGVIALGLASYADGRTARRQGGARVMHFSLPARIVASIVSLGFMALLLILLSRPENRSEAALRNGLPAFALVMIPGFLFFYIALTARVSMTDEWLDDGTKRIAWSAVTSVAESRMLGQYRVKGDGGQLVRISHLMVGQAEFAQAVVTHVPRQKIKCWDSLQRKLA